MAHVLPEIHLRLCLVRQKDGSRAKALFHCWAYEAYVKKESFHLIGVPQGQVCHLWGIVELENGEVVGVPPEEIRFLDNKFQDYAWPDGGDEHGV